jgi:hypothetical protein
VPFDASIGAPAKHRLEVGKATAVRATVVCRLRICRVCCDSRRLTGPVGVAPPKSAFFRGGEPM